MPLKLQPGMKFGDWEVIERDYNPTSKQHSTFWFCKCHLCGKTYSVSRDALVNGKSSCCNHCKGEKIRGKAEARGLNTWRKGDRFGMLEIIESAGTRGNHSYVKCKCDCGNIVNIRVSNLKGQSHSKTISCGCASQSSGEIKITQLLAKADEAKRIITDAEQARLQIIKETDEAKKGLTRIKAEAKTEELKNSATKTATAALNGINSLLGGNKISRLEQENKQLHNEVKNLNGQIERLHADMQKLKDNHASEMSRVNEQHRQEISSLKSIIEKAKKWFPFLQQYLDIERLCRSVGFNEQQSSMLMDGEPILYTGLLHSNEYRRNIPVRNVTAEILQDSKKNIHLCINRMPITKWFNEQLCIGQKQQNRLRI